MAGAYRRASTAGKYVLNGIIQRLREGCDLTKLNEAQTELIKLARRGQRAKERRR